MSIARKILMGAAGGAAADGEYIDDLFETRLWDGTSGSRTINNGIDLSGEGGLVWIKRRTGSSENSGLFDTVRGAGKWVVSNYNSAESTDMNRVSAFNNNGFSLGSDNMVNNSGHRYVGYTFRKQKNFFDIVTYTGNNTSGRQIAHNLGSVPGCVLVKRLSGNSHWAMYHRGVNGGSNPEQYWMTLNETYAQQQQPHWNNTAPTSTHFTVGNDYEINGPSSQTYVAYIFAHDEAIFGNKGNNSVIKCGNYTGNGQGGAGPVINLGWEPQWLLIKRTNSNEDWMVFDHMRTSTREHMWLDDYRPNSANGDGDGAGSDGNYYLNWTSTGFQLFANTAHTNGNGDNYIYIAIRRADGYVGKPVTAGTQVFTPVAGSSGEPLFKTPNHYIDMSLQKNSNYASSTATWNVVNRLRSQEILNPDDNQPESWNTYHSFDYQNGESNFTGGSGIRFSWNWKRYAGFDVVYYHGNGTSGRTISHSLNNIPEMIVCKKAGGTGGWQTYHVGAGNTKYLYWNQDYPAQVSGAVWANTTPTKSVFTVGSGGEVNENGYLYLTLLFSSVEGVSKCGSYTGTGSDLTITTGFQPRFVIIKRTDSSESWFVLDTVRGWGSGNDQYLILNSTAQQASADFGNPVASGFLVKGTSSGTNTSGGTYIYYAHA